MVCALRKSKKLLLEKPLCRGRQGGSGEIRLGEISSNDFLAVARAYEDGATTGVVAQLHVKFAVADHERLLRVDLEFLGSVTDQFRFRFAAFAIVLGLMRTDVDSVERRAFLLECAHDVAMYALDIFHREVPAT